MFLNSLNSLPVQTAVSTALSALSARSDVCGEESSLSADLAAAD